MASLTPGRYDTAWVPAGCGVTPSGLEEDCIWDPARIRVLRRVAIQLVESPSAKQKAARGKPSKGADKSPSGSSPDVDGVANAARSVPSASGASGKDGTGVALNA